MTIYFLLIIIVYVIYCYFKRTLNYWKYKNVKGPKPIPFFGNYKEVAFRRKPKFEFYHEIYKQYPKEKVVGVYQMTTPALLIRDLDIVKQVLIKDFEVFPDRGVHYSKRGLGENMIHCDADTWKNLRNKFTVLFTSNRIKNIFHLLTDRGDKFVNYINSIIIKDPNQDAFKIASKYGVSTTIATTYGWDIDTFNEKNDWYNILDEDFIYTYWNELDLLCPGLLTNFNLSVTTRETRKICHKLLKICYLQNRVSCDTNMLNVKNALLNLKENNQNVTQGNSGFKVTDDLLAGQLWVFHMAGYINNTLSMTYAMYHLARNPDIQDKLIYEIDEVMNECGGELTYEWLNKMNYLKMVFEETLRMHPTSHVISRNVVQNIKLDGTNLTIDKGSTVIISPYAIQHDEKYYPKPEIFDPERFSANNVRGHPCSFLSFGAGRRSCLASQYARFQFSVGLVKLLYNFRVETTRSTCCNLAFDRHHMLIKPNPGVELKFVARKKL